MAAIGHLAAGLACARAHHGKLTWKGGLAFCALSLLPDLDVMGFAFRIPYSDPLGHRGATHSLAFAGICGLIAWALSRRGLTAGWVTLAVASHPLLDSLTDGGLGVAFLWPFLNERFFAPWQPLPVAPIGWGMLSVRGSYVVAIEVLGFLPLWMFALTRRQVTHAASPARCGPNRDL